MFKGEAEEGTGEVANSQDDGENDTSSVVGYFDYLMQLESQVGMVYNAAFQTNLPLAAYRFDGDICTTAQAPLGTVGRPSSKHCLTDQSIPSLLCSQRQIADS